MDGMTENLRRQPIWRLALCAGLLAGAFWWPSTKFEFVNYDDGEYTFENAALKDGLTPAAVGWAFNCGYAANWHPLTWMSHALDISLARALEGAGLVVRTKPKHGTWILDCDEPTLARVSHVHNVLLQGFNTVFVFLLVWIFLARMGGDTATNRWLALFAALVWSVHPLRCEVVCWVSERKELLSVSFMLLALLAYLGRETSRRPRLFYALSLLAFALALMAKPVAVTLPLVVFGYDWIYRGRPFGRSFVRVLPYAALAAFVCALTMFAQREAMPDLRNAGLEIRLSNILSSPVVYLVQTVFPRGLSSCYFQESRFQWAWAGPGILLVAGMAGVCLAWLIRRPHVARSSLATAAFACVWLYGGLLPMLGLVKVGRQPHSDRYTYWVGVGFVVILSLLLKRALAAWPRVFFQGRPEPGYTAAAAEFRRRARIVCGLALLPYAAAGFLRMWVWHDSLRLFRDGTEKSMDPEEAGFYAHTLLMEDRYKEAEAIMRQVDSLRKNCLSRANLALILSQKEHLESIEEVAYLIKSALGGDPTVAEGYAAQGNLDLRTGDTKGAVENYRKAVKYGFKDGLVMDLLKQYDAGRPIGLDRLKTMARDAGKVRKEK